MSFRSTKEIPKGELPNLYRRLKGMMENSQFEAKMLNIAVLRNCKTIEEDAQNLIRERQEIIDEHAEFWSEGEDLPDDVEAGDMKTIENGQGGEVPRFPNKGERLEAEQKIGDLFDGTSEYTFEQVPAEAFEVPEGNPIAVWDGLGFMFKRQDPNPEG